MILREDRMISQRLRKAVKSADVRQYHLANAIGVDHSTLSAWLNGISSVRRGDPRIVQLGSLVGVPPRACFARNPARLEAVPLGDRKWLRREHRHGRDRNRRRVIRRNRQL
jgi:transcriptional regulator with XRE-family HTH domain